MKNILKNLETIGKEKLFLLIGAGILLMVLSMPGEKEEKKTKESVELVQTEQNDTAEAYAGQLEKQLTNILKEMEGVGEVHVMIVLKGSENKEILKDENITSENTKEVDSEGGERDITSYGKSETTIFDKDGSGKETPYILSENHPQVEGVAVVAQGAGNLAVKEKIIQLIKALFGIEVNKIMVTV